MGLPQQTMEWTESEAVASPIQEHCGAKDALKIPFISLLGDTGFIALATTKNRPNGSISQWDD
jgi:hypothetical protein